MSDDLADRVRYSVEVLARTPMQGMSLEEWGYLSNNFLRSADRIEILEAECIKLRRDLEIANATINILAGDYESVDINDE